MSADPLPSWSGLRVAIVLGSLGWGGAERQALILARHLQRRRAATVAVFGLGPPGRCADICAADGIPCHGLRAVGSRWSALAALRMRAAMRALAPFRPALLLPYTAAANVACAAFGRHSGARACVWNQRDEGLLRQPARLERRAVARATRFVANSAAGAAFLARELAVDPARVRVVANALEAPPPASGRDAWRQRLGIGAEALVVCMPANLSARKDHATLVAAWNRVAPALRAAGRPAFLVLAGRDDGVAAHLRHLLADDLAPTLLLPGAIDDLPGLLAASDLGACSSRSEGCPNAVLECMAAGLAVAGSDIPGIRAALPPGSDDCLAPAGDAAALAEVLLRLARDPARRAGLAERNRAHAVTAFAPPRMLEAMEEEIRAALATAGAGAPP